MLDVGKQMKPILSYQDLGTCECIMVALGLVPVRTLVTFPRTDHFMYIITLAAWGQLV